MRNYQWLSACLALVAAALVAGCGGGGSSTSAPATSESGSGSTSTAELTTTEASGQATPDDVYQACLDALKDVGDQATVKQGCGQARDAFEQCATQASSAPEGSARDTALQACQDAANNTVDALESSP